MIDVDQQQRLRDLARPAEEIARHDAELAQIQARGLKGEKVCAYQPCSRTHARRSDFCSDLCRELANPIHEHVQPERVLQRAVEQLLRDLARAGRIVSWYHAPALLGSVPHSQQIGFPDLTIKLRPGERPVQLELKQIGKQLRPDQVPWIDGEGAACCWTMDDVLAALARWDVDLTGLRRAV
jgi:hypothetical protein